MVDDRSGAAGAGFLSRRRLRPGDEVMILVGRHGGSAGRVAKVDFGASEALTRYTISSFEPPYERLGVFEPDHLRGLYSGLRAGRLVLTPSSGLSLDKIMARIELLLPEEWDLDLSRIGTNEGAYRYRAYAGDPRDGTSDVLVYGAGRLQAARRLRDALEQRFG